MTVRRPSRMDDPTIAGKISTAQHRRRAAAVAVGLVLAAIVVPPFINVNRFRRGIVRSISAGLGRPVQASSVELQLFPLPGFVLHTFTVAEDPAYGAEPFMVAPSVTAVLRASTLWHRRVEIATLRFDTPSVNLVRNPSGQWNFRGLLHDSPVLRQKRTAAARRSSPAPFPYVEASDARINFKLDREKLPFSLEQANLSFWKESANRWRIRIRARPVRTDLTVADAGELRGEGSLTTTGTSIGSPLRASVEWRRVELGEISRLVSGEDDGWRGTVDWTAHAGGTLEALDVTSDIAVEGFRRAEFMPSSEMDLTAHCQAQYGVVRRQLDSLDCDAPAGDGHLRLRQTSPRGAGKQTSLRFAVERAPAGFFLDLLRHVHPGMSADAGADGEVNGEWNCGGPVFSAQACRGSFKTTAIRLRLPHVDRPMILTPLELQATGGQAGEKDIAEAQVGGRPILLRLMPAHVSLGGSAPATLSGAATLAGYHMQVEGPANLERLGHLGAAFHVPGTPMSTGAGEIQSLRGAAQLALAVDGRWLPYETLPGSSPAQYATQMRRQSTFAPSQWSGTIQIHGAQMKLAQLPGPIQIDAAQIDFSSARTEWTGIDAAWGHTGFQGSVQWQARCPREQSGCGPRFSLHTRLLDIRRLQAAWQGGNPPGFLDQMNPWADRSPRWNDVSGTLTANALSLGKIPVKNVRVDLRLKGRTATLESISGEIFGGTLAGPPDGHVPGTPVGSVRWGDGAGSYRFRMALQHVQPNRAGAIWRERWGPGTADVRLDITTRGRTAAQLAKHAAGSFDVLWKDGAFRSLEGAAPAQPLSRFQQWRAKGAIRGGNLVLTSSQIVLPRGHAGKLRIAASQSVTGNIAFSRTLHLRLEPSGIAISGPLSMPLIERIGHSAATNGENEPHPPPQRAQER